MVDEGSELVECAAAGARGDAVAAMALALEVWRDATLRADERLVAETSLRLAWCCLQVGDAEAGLVHAAAARSFFAEFGSDARGAVARAVQAWLLLEIGLTEIAVEEAVGAVAEAERIGHPLAESWACNVLGIVFWASKQIDRAEPMIARAVALARDVGDQQIVGWWLINLAGVRAEYGYRQQSGSAPALWRAAFEEALTINDGALAVAEAATSPRPDAWSARIALCNAAEYSIEIGAFDAAEDFLARWDAVAITPGNRLSAQYLYTKSSLRMRQGRPLEALPLCERSLALAREARNTDCEAHALRFLSEIHEGLGRLDKALAFYRQFHAVQSTLAAEQVQRRARMAEIHYDTDRLKRLADQATRRADDLARTSRLDPLTGMGNRRMLDETLDALRVDLQPFCIAVIDLDHFKQINDRFSHAVGDAVLRRIAGLLKSTVRRQDVAARMGGEEFVLIVLGAERHTTLFLCERVKEGLAGVDWSDLDPTLRVTASIGIASHVDAADPSRVMALADERLYRAKAEGRDRIVAGDPSGADLRGGAGKLRGAVGAGVMN